MASTCTEARPPAASSAARATIRGAAAGIGAVETEGTTTSELTTSDADIFSTGFDETEDDAAAADVAAGEDDFGTSSALRSAEETDVGRGAMRTAAPLVELVEESGDER